MSTFATQLNDVRAALAEVERFNTVHVANGRFGSGGGTTKVASGGRQKTAKAEVSAKERARIQRDVKDAKAQLKREMAVRDAATHDAALLEAHIAEQGGPPSAHMASVLQLLQDAADHHSQRISDIQEQIKSLRSGLPRNTGKSDELKAFREDQRKAITAHISALRKTIRQTQRIATKSGLPIDKPSLRLLQQQLSEQQSRLTNLKSATYRQLAIWQSGGVDPTRLAALATRLALLQAEIVRVADQPRDARGRFISGGGSSKTKGASKDYAKLFQDAKAKMHEHMAAFHATVNVDWKAHDMHAVLTRAYQRLSQLYNVMDRQKNNPTSDLSGVRESIKKEKANIRNYERKLAAYTKTPKSSAARLHLAELARAFKADQPRDAHGRFESTGGYKETRAAQEHPIGPHTQVPIGGAGLRAHREAEQLAPFAAQANAAYQRVLAEQGPVAARQFEAAVQWDGHTGLKAVQAHLAQLQQRVSDERDKLTYGSANDPARREVATLRQIYFNRLTDTQHPLNALSRHRLEKEMALLDSYGGQRIRRVGARRSLAATTHAPIAAQVDATIAKEAAYVAQRLAQAKTAPKRVALPEIARQLTALRAQMAPMGQAA